MALDEASDKTSAATGKISATMWLAFMVGLTVFAGGIGAAFGLYLTSPAMLGKPVKEVAESPSAAGAEKPNVRDLPPIVTNIGQSSDVWVRLQAAIIFDPTTVEKPDVMAVEVASDILGFLQTLSVLQLGGPSGLQHLREDLNDRAIVRSDGRVRELVIESIVVQ